MDYKIPVVLVIAALIIFSGYFIITGNFLDFFEDSQISEIVDYSNEWLETEFAKNHFTDAIAIEPYKVLEIPDIDNIALWLVPIKSNNAFIGYLEIRDIEDIPGTITKFAEPSDTIFKITKDKAYSLMFKFTDYKPYQIVDPILVVHRKTIMWYSPVYSDDELIDYLESPAMWAIDEIVFDQHGEIKLDEED